MVVCLEYEKISRRTANVRFGTTTIPFSRPTKSHITTLLHSRPNTPKRPTLSLWKMIVSIFTH